MPLFKKSATAIGREILDVSSNVFNDVTENNDISLASSLLNRGMEGVTNLKRKAVSKMQGHGVRRPYNNPSKQKRQSKSKPRKQTTHKKTKKKDTSSKSGKGKKKSNSKREKKFSYL